MKSKSNKPIIIFCVKNFWSAGYIGVFGFLLSRVSTSQIADIVSAALLFWGAAVTIIGLAFRRKPSETEQKTENDERMQMIIQKANLGSTLVTVGICYIIVFVCLALNQPYISLLVLGIVFINQLSQEMLEKIFSNKY